MTPRRMHQRVVYLFGLFIALIALLFILGGNVLVRAHGQAGAAMIAQESLSQSVAVIERYLTQQLNAQLEYVEHAQRKLSQNTHWSNEHILENGYRVNVFDEALRPLNKQSALPPLVMAHLQTGVQQGHLLKHKQVSFYQEGVQTYLLISLPHTPRDTLFVYHKPFDIRHILNSLSSSSDYWFGISQPRLAWQSKAPSDWQLHAKPLAAFAFLLQYGLSPEFTQASAERLTRDLYRGMLMVVSITIVLLLLLGQRLILAPSLRMQTMMRRLQKKASQLEREEAASRRLAWVVQHMRDAVYFTSPQIEITWVNRAFEALSGYRFDDVRGKSPLMFHGVLTDAAVKRQIRGHLRERRFGQFELINYHKDGRAYWLELAITPVFGEHGEFEGFMAVQRDISLRKKLQASLAHAAQQAQSANIAKSRFLASMSHELRTPMNGVLGSAELLSASSLNKEQQELVHTLHDASKHMLGVLNDILDFSKIEAGKLQLHDSPFSLSELAAKMQRLYLPLCREKGLAFYLNTTLPKGLFCLGDETRMQQILQNLLNNAWKFTQQGRIDVGLTIQQESAQWMLELRVQDSGIGIDTHKLEQIFKPFSQGESDTTRRFGGSGLGLSITHELVKAMKGEIRVNSELGRGSCFIVHMPIRLVDAPQRHAARLTQAVNGQGRCALIVDDNKTNAMILKKFLTQRQLCCELAENGFMALEKVQQQHIDIIFMDNHMPVMDGFAATQAIKGMVQYAHIPIIACTADVFEQTQQRLLAVGCEQVLCKPISGKDLDAVLAAHLAPASAENTPIS